MALYLGRDRVKINLNGIAYRVNFFSSTIVEPSNRLKSSDGFVLKDSNGIYLIPKLISDDIDNVFATSDNYILTDKDGLYLIFEEDEG